MACVDREKVVLVGRGGVRARRLADGELAWGGRTIAFPDNSMPSGRGFFVIESAAAPAAPGGQDARAPAPRYFLPLSNAEVVGIDLAAGKIVQVSKSRKGNVPGNLICHRGKIISQGLEAVDGYDQLDVVRAEVRRRLAANPDDAEALSLRGRNPCWMPTSGGGGRVLPPGVPVGPGPADARVVPRHAAGRSADRLCRLSRLGRGDRAAVGQSRAARGLSPLDGRRPAAGGRIGRRPGLLSEADRPGAGPPSVGRDQQGAGRAARSVGPRTTGLLAREAKDAAAAQIDRAVEARLKAAVAAGSIEPLQRFFDYFGELPAAAAARDELVRRLTSAGRLLEAELAAAPAAGLPISMSAAEHGTAWPHGPGGSDAPAPTNNRLLNAFDRGGVTLQRQPGTVLPRPRRCNSTPIGRRLSASTAGGASSGRSRCRPTGNGRTSPIAPGPRPAPTGICCWSRWDGGSWRSIRWGRGPTARRECCGPRT